MRQPAVRLLCGERGVRRRQTRDRYTEGRTAHVVEPLLVTERNGARLAAVLAADAHLQAGLGGTAIAHGQGDQLAHTARVEHLERVVGEDPVLDVERDEPSG